MNRRRFLVSSLASTALGAVRGGSLHAFAQAPQALPALSPALREKLMRDPLRPQFHLLPRANWMNDPCAPRFFRGKYHMFFQYNPGAAVWGDMHWAHAVSPDLIYWKHLPVALSPTLGGDDASGCFTGSVLPGAHVPTILYTGVARSSPDQATIRGEGLREVQCLATSTDPDLLKWEKMEKPVLNGPPPGLQVTGFRDPCPWKEGDAWYLGVGSGFSKVGGAVLLYTSRDGRNWTYLHPLAQGKWNEGSQSNPVDTGEMWECPDFFPLGDKHVLLYSTERKVCWQVGTFDKRELRFHSEAQGLLDHGSYYAMKSMVDAKGRRILWGWVQETRTPEECTVAGWAGAMALPRVLSLGPDNELRMETPQEFDSLRTDTQKLEVPQRSATLVASLAGMPIRTRAAEIIFRFKAGKDACGLELKGGAVPIFAIHNDGGSSKPSATVGGKAVPLSPDAEGTSLVRLWIDGSIIEALIDSKEAMTARCYTPSPDGIQLTWTGAADALKSLQVSRVTPISDDRLTS
jgi:beta-fructofuranosidase